MNNLPVVIRRRMAGSLHIVVVLVLLQDIILNCLSFSVVLMCRDIVLLTGLSISGKLEQLSSDIVNACSISVFKYKLEFVNFTPFVRVEFT